MRAPNFPLANIPVKHWLIYQKFYAIFYLEFDYLTIPTIDLMSLDTVDATIVFPSDSMYLSCNNFGIIYGENSFLNEPMEK